jgi:hypothetical protein
MARDDEGEPVDRAEAPGRPGCPRPAGPLGEAAVRHDVAPGDRPRRREEVALERPEPVRVDRHVAVLDALAREVRREPPTQIRDEAVALLRPVDG